MADFNSSEYWKSTKNYQSFELRSHRFRDEMLPVFYQWLGITEDALVLDAGCGSGVFTRYLAKGLTTGHITGFDINETFIHYGRDKIKELGLGGRAALETADGYHLHYPDCCFDAVTNYTYTGVLADKKAGLLELIRVCRHGGVISSVAASNAVPQASYQGNYPFEGAEELQRLSEREEDIFNRTQKKSGENPLSDAVLFESCGLSDIHIYPLAHLMCYNDTYFPAGYRKALAVNETADHIQWLKGRYAENEAAYEEQGFSAHDFNRLMELLGRKLNYLSCHFETDKSYEWHGGLNFIITGRKA